jgi:exodeoxyribonuclease VIII
MGNPSPPLWFPSKPGVYAQPFPEYLADDSALNSGVIVDFINHSPKRARSRLPRSTDKITASMRMGIAFHMKVLEPRRFKEDVAVYEGRRDLRTLEYRAFLESSGIDPANVLSPSEAEQVQHMYEALEQNEHAFHLLTRAIPEATAYAKHHETGLWLKARPDALHKDRIVDLKTTAPKHFRPMTFREHADRYGYPLQVGFYALVTRLLGFDIRAAHIVAVENEFPFDVVPYRIDPPKLEILIAEIENALRGYAECLVTGIWPGAARNTELDLFPTEHQQTEKDQLLENQTELSGGPLRDNPNEDNERTTSEN